MKHPTLRLAFLVAVTLILGACGGEDSTVDGPLMVDDLERLRSEPEVVQLRGLLDRTDTLLVPGVHARYSLSAEGETLDGTLVDGLTCSGARCVAMDGTAITLRDLINPAAGAALSEARLGAQGGFDSLTTRGGFEIAEQFSDITLAAAVSVTSYGFWGAHGYAAVEIGSGPLSGQVEGVSFDGDLAIVRAYALGDATGTNLTGIGSATWRGIAEAASTLTFERHRGTATVTIADLSRPRVNVSIEVPGQAIGAPGWADMPLADGRFSVGTPGSGYLAGNFHGPAHGEAWGVFDTADHVGAFGAKRER